MATFTPGSFAKALNDFDPSLRKAQRVGIAAASLAIKREVEKNLPNSKRLSGVGKKGVKIGVRYDIKEYNNHDVSFVRAFGPVQFLESDTKPHQIPKAIGSGGSRKPSKGRTAKVKFVVIPEFSSGEAGGVFSRVQHPGTRGQHPWAHGLEKALPQVEVAFNEALTAALIKGFGF